MLEIVNNLPRKRFEQLDNFLSYLAIYEDTRRNRALINLLKDNQKIISGKVGVEAGAGLGFITEFILKLGADKIFAIEENKLCYEFLKKKFKDNPRVEVICERIENFKPSVDIDFIFQELYGPLLLDESILALSYLKFKPRFVIPNQGLILIEEIKLKEIKDPIINEELLKSFEGSLITDLFPNFRFKSPRVLAKWEFTNSKKEYEFKYKVKKYTDVIALGMEIWHNNRRIIGTADSSNWPYVFAPTITKKSFVLSFRYHKGYTQIFFD